MVSNESTAIKMADTASELLLLGLDIKPPVRRARIVLHSKQAVTETGRIFGAHCALLIIRPKVQE
jgi:hypothetical protein